MRPPQPSPALSKFWHHEVSVLSHKPTAEPSTAYDLSIKSIISRGRCGGGRQNDRSKTYGKRNVFAHPPKWSVCGKCAYHPSAIYPSDDWEKQAETEKVTGAAGLLNISASQTLLLSLLLVSRLQKKYAWRSTFLQYFRFADPISLSTFGVARFTSDKPAQCARCAPLGPGNMSTPRTVILTF